MYNSPEATTEHVKITAANHVYIDAAISEAVKACRLVMFPERVLIVDH